MIMTGNNDSTTEPDLIPLAAGAVALGYTPASAIVMVSGGRFRVRVVKSGRYNMVDRSEVLAELKRRRPHITRPQHEAIIKAHEAAEEKETVPPSRTDETVVVMLANRKWITTAEVARALGIVPAVVNAKHAAGTLPFALESDPKSKQGGRRAASLEVAAYLATQEPAWPTAEDFAAVPSLDLAEVKRALGDDTPVGADDPTTQAYLRSRETISMADYALMIGISKDNLRRRLQRAQKAQRDENEMGVVRVEAPKKKRQIKAGMAEVEAPKKKRQLKRVRSDYAAAELRKGSPAS